MLVTQSYLGTAPGKYRCLFFLLLEDYIEERTQPMQELNQLLERFARNLKSSGALVRPFTGDIEQTGREIQRKHWTAEQHAQLGM